MGLMSRDHSARRVQTEADVGWRRALHHEVGELKAALRHSPGRVRRPAGTLKGRMSTQTHSRNVPVSLVTGPRLERLSIGAL
jgi:hypothetical protein